MVRNLTLAALLLLAARPAAAEDVHLHYTAYAAGLPVLAMEADWNILPTAYKVHLALHTVGTLALAFKGQSDSIAEGVFEAGHPKPRRYFSYGTLGGMQRVTQIDYPGHEPRVRQMVPPDEDERDPVPETQQAGTVDSLSAMAELVRQVNATGRCDGRISTFDGRRLSELAARTGSVQQLEATSRSSYSGLALRCDFEGRQLGGFIHDEDQTRLREPQHGTAWFAATTPGGEQVPVRIEFRTRWFGTATMYVTAAAR